MSGALKQALSLHRDGRDDEAAVQADRALREAPKDPAVWLLRGRIRMKADPEGADSDLWRAAELAAFRPDVVRRVAQLLFSLGRTERALMAIDAALERGPDRELLHRQADGRQKIGWLFGFVESVRELVHAFPSAEDCKRLATILEGCGDHEGAREAYRAAYALTPDDAALALAVARHANRADRWDEAVEVLRPWLDRPLDPERAREVVVLLVEAGALDLAEMAALRLLDDRPDDAPLLAQVAELALWTGRREEARNRAGRALEKDANCAAAWTVCAALARDPEDCRRCVAAARAADPLALQPRVWEADLLRRGGAVEECIARLEPVVHLAGAYYLPAQVVRLLATLQRSEKGPADKDAYYETAERLGPVVSDDARTYEEAMKGWVAPLVRVCETAMERFGGNLSMTPTARLPSGAVLRVSAPPDARHAAVGLQGLLRTRPLDEVLQKYEALKERYPFAPTVLCHHGEVLLWVGRYEEAECLFAEARRLVGNAKWAWIGLGAATMLRGDPERALDIWEESIRVLPEPGRTMFVYRAEALYRLGRPADADLEEALRRNPDRLAARVLRALTSDDDEALEPRWADALAFAAPVFRNVALDLGWRSPPKDPGDRRRLLEAALVAMRGNRASRVVSYWIGGTMRFWEAPAPG